MIALPACSISLAARTWLAESRPVWVFHLSARACNLIDDRDRVIALVTDQVGDGPFNVVLPPIIFPLHVTPDSSVDAAPVSLRVGGLVADLSAASTWNPRPDWARLRECHESVRAFLPLLRGVLRAHAPPASLAALAVDLPPRPPPSRPPCCKPPRRAGRRWPTGCAPATGRCAWRAPSGWPVWGTA
jgi:hypothetical protein